MRLLLDSHALIWWLTEDPELGPAASSAIKEPANDVLVSVASVWEIAIKRASGRLELDRDLATAIDASGFMTLQISTYAAIEAATLPRHHRDPFDRMLVAQARLEKCTIVTGDEDIARYGVPILRV